MNTTTSRRFTLEYQVTGSTPIESLPWTFTSVEDAELKAREYFHIDGRSGANEFTFTDRLSNRHGYVWVVPAARPWHRERFQDARAKELEVKAARGQYRHTPGRREADPRACVGCGYTPTEVDERVVGRCVPGYHTLALVGEAMPVKDVWSDDPDRITRRGITSGSAA